jgi:hypothetical protein
MLKNQVAITGSPSTSWWRAMRLLLEEGKPLPPQTLLTLGPINGVPRPFGVLSETANNRLIAWLPLPTDIPEPTANHPHVITDHITLDLWNGKSHPTWFDHDGKRQHPKVKQGWKLHALTDDLSAWFTFLVRRSVLEQQSFRVEVGVTSPTLEEGERRKAEFIRHVQGVQGTGFEIPTVILGDYVLCMFFIAQYPSADSNPIADYCGKLRLDEQIEDIGSEITCPVKVSRITVGDTHLVVATSCPPGRLKTDCVFGVPTGSPTVEVDAE